MIINVNPKNKFSTSSVFFLNSDFKLNMSSDIDIPDELFNIIDSKIRDIIRYPKVTSFNTNLKDFDSFFTAVLGVDISDDLDIFRELAGDIFLHLSNQKNKSLNVYLPILKNRTNEEVIKTFLEGFLLADYRYDKFLKVDVLKIENLNLFVKSDDKFGDTINKTVALVDSIKYCRDLINTPPSHLNPTSYLEEIKILANENQLSLKIISGKELYEQGMECLYSVSTGSIHKSSLLILENKPTKPSNKKPICLIGKGVTFDSGGINIKRSDEILEKMKYDMAGSAVVASTVLALKKMNVNKHIIAVLGLAENMVGANAYKPGDILKAYNGKTVEIINTDAEGRLALADALSYVCKNYDPEFIFDIATLTGAAVTALGYDIVPILGNNLAFVKSISDFSYEVGEKCWPLPLDKIYLKYIKGDISDLKNVHEGMNAGVITAAIFLNEFVDSKVKWVHFDIAGKEFIKKGKSYQPKGATASLVRLFTEFILQY